MKIEKLIELLKKCPPDAEIILASDVFLNNLHPITGVMSNCEIQVNEEVTKKVYIITAGEDYLEQVISE